MQLPPQPLYTHGRPLLRGEEESSADVFAVPANSRGGKLRCGRSGYTPYTNLLSTEGGPGPPPPLHGEE
ncbi:hypothetical protein [Pyrobaculum ferrireducens]|uniref:Uncharacterized protein n=1 Tax=Pyrobaculum ferrireducens TaxID=1104324 RepID=G7VHC5_9CREN|nr:hypothetical protein [Pyrobaculum ferrireducens]AET32028.1 hypothetical protein P186_0576 [Pyrobaculum ferrireducens]